MTTYYIRTIVLLKDKSHKFTYSADRNITEDASKSVLESHITNILRNLKLDDNFIRIDDYIVRKSSVLGVAAELMINDQG